MGKTKPNSYLPMLIKWYRHRFKPKDFRLVRPVKDAYSTREVGYEDTFDYPNLYDEKTGEVGICGGHGIYAWAKREDYEIINQKEDE